MTLEPGEYVFECPECDDGIVHDILTTEPCPECDGEGFFDVLKPSGETVRTTCDVCEGVGVVKVSMMCQLCDATAEISVDEEEAAELIAAGHAPLRTPST